jgi:periplasmic divalent cation tolerance protein
MTDMVLVLTTMPADERAEALADALVEERLAACVNVAAPMTSVYRWQGTIERAREQQLVIKTSAEQLDRVRARVRELHPYELPELIVLPVSGAAADFLAWVRAETSGSAGGRTPLP